MKIKFTLCGLNYDNATSLIIGIANKIARKYVLQIKKVKIYNSTAHQSIIVLTSVGAFPRKDYENFVNDFTDEAEDLIQDIEYKF